MIGRSPSFKRALARLDRIAGCDATVLIEGETGTGKELFAREIHYGGVRRGQPFIPVNCGGLPDTLLENELFGHARGAFTDAHAAQPGLVDLADRGTLFLDEVDALTPRGQTTLLRFLQDRSYRPLGSRTQRTADVRVVAASNRSLEALAGAKEFRLDLLYRLRLLYLELPPLRERPGDAELLARHFVETASDRFGGPARPLSAATLVWLDRHGWPGNVRELENTVYQAFLMQDGPELVLAPGDVDAGRPHEVGDMGFHASKAQAIDNFERSYLTRALRQVDGNVSAAARLIGTERRHLGRLLKKHGIEASGL